MRERSNVNTALKLGIKQVAKGQVSTIRRNYEADVLSISPPPE